MSKTTNDKRIQKYRIRLVIAGFIALGLSTGILINAIGQFILPINEDMGYSVGRISLAFSIICAGIIFTATAAARLIDRYSSGVCMAISTGVLTVFTFLLSFTTEIWQLYLCTIVIGLAFTGLHTLPVSVMINRAFPEERKGLALSIAFSGSGIGGMIFNPLLNNIINSYGWRMGFVAMAVIYLTGGSIIIWLVRMPKDIQEYGKKIQSAEYMKIEMSENHPGRITESIGLSDMKYKDVIKTRIFIRLGISILIINGTGTAIMMHTVPYMIDIGITSSRASFYISGCLLLLAVNKIVFGYICDKFGIKKGTIFGVACYISGILIMIAMQASQWIYLMFLLFGTMGLATSTVIAPLMVSWLFGNKEYTRIFGAVMVFTGIGNSLLPALMGFIFDVSGSYVPGWALLISLLIVALVLCLVNFKMHKKEDVKI